MGIRLIPGLVLRGCVLVKGDGIVKLVARCLTWFNWLPVWWWCLPEEEMEKGQQVWCGKRDVSLLMLNFRGC